METKNSIQCERCIIVPDVHQDIAWVERVFEREQVMASNDSVVFLGDYFDSSKKPRKRAGVGETCEFLERTRAALGGRCVFLLGNHDIQYWEAKPICDAHRTPRHLHNRCGMSFSKSAAKKVASNLPLDFWTNARLFIAVNGWLLSHAGLAACYWPQAETVERSLEILQENCVGALLMMRFGPQHLLAAGQVRGGTAPVGGLTWQDWNDEFADALPLPQIVGHTIDELAGARANGRSWCIDGGQSCYGMLTGQNFETRTIERERELRRAERVREPEL